jgi:hypothetical protein
MELRRADLDAAAFALALGAIGLATFGFLVNANGAALIMCGICLAGLVVGRLVGVAGGTLLVVALGLTVVLWIVWVDPLAGPRKTSALAHFTGGGLAGWALAQTLRRRRWSAWIAAALVGVLALTVAWEIGEWIGDRALDTALIPDRTDSALDTFFGCLGGAAGVGFARLISPRTSSG